MKSKYYNMSALSMAYKKFNQYDIYYALSEVQKYLKKYPNDIKTIIFYCHILLKLNELELVQEYLNVVELLDKALEYEQEILKIKLYLNSYQGNFDECKKILQNPTLSKKCRLSFLTYLKKQLGNLVIENIENEKYICKQINNYDEKMAIEHIKNHFNNNLCEINGVNSIFNDNFSLEDIVNKLKEILPNEQKLNSRGFENEYIFKYDKCRTVSGVSTDYFFVCAFQNTNHIITMYPCLNTGKLPFIDLNDYEKEGNGKVKRISQIEKFNQRYGIK